MSKLTYLAGDDFDDETFLEECFDGLEEEIKEEKRLLYSGNKWRKDGEADLKEEQKESGSSSNEEEKFR